MLQGPVRVGGTSGDGESAAGLAGAGSGQDRSGCPGQVAVPQSLSPQCLTDRPMGASGGARSVPASAWPPGTPRCQRSLAEGAGGQRARPPSSPLPPALAPGSCPSPGPHLHGPPHFLFSFCIVAQGENSARGGWFFGFVFCLFV